jgi:hypothetical protein
MTGKERPATKGLSCAVLLLLAAFTLSIRAQAQVDLHGTLYGGNAIAACEQAVSTKISEEHQGKIAFLPSLSSQPNTNGETVVQGGGTSTTTQDQRKFVFFCTYDATKSIVVQATYYYTAPSASQVQLSPALGEGALCVDAPDISRSLGKIDVNDARNRLIKALIHQSSANKSSPIKVEALINHAECQFILSTTLLNLRSLTLYAGGSSYGLGAPNQQWQVELRYRIYRANDHVAVAEDTVTLMGGGAQDVVNAALSSVAKDVVKHLREKPGS